tara:strand:- start:6667 stop:8748 length:2082 start_codon:yes stop_codon:yes gene_type:complete
MNEFLQQRINGLLGDEMPVMEMADGGTVGPGPVSNFEMESIEGMDNPETMMALDQAAATQSNPNADLEMAINELMMVRDQTTDEGEVKYIDGLIESAQVGANAPMADLAMELSQAGRGGDVTLAHLRPGEVILPPEAFDDPKFESLIERKFKELDMDPEAYVVGSGIASLNPITGLEEFGWLKKSWKSVKKVAKKVIEPVAKVAQFIPGPWQVPAALYTKAMTVYNVAKGRASPLALASLMSPLPGGNAAGSAAGSAVGSAASSAASSGGISNLLSKAGDFVFEGATPGNLFTNTAGAIGKGVGKVGDYIFEGKTPGNLASNLGRDVFGMADPRAVDSAATGGAYTVQAGDTLGEIAQKQGISLDKLAEFNKITDQDYIQVGQVLNLPGAGGNVVNNLANAAANGSQKGGFGAMLGRAISGTPGEQTPFQEFLDDQLGLDPNGGGVFRLLGGGPENTGGRGGLMGSLGGIFGGGGGDGGGGFNLGALGAAGIAGLLGKLAYDEAKDRKGVPLTPLTQMNAAGRYNIEAEVARRMGEPAPDPVEFGLLPAGTLPTLSGGRAPTTAQAALEQQKATGMRYGGPVMAYRKGGEVKKYADGGTVYTDEVDLEEFEEMAGGIDGEGTEVSDDIPAMLSDGEFVMTGQAVRGAGAYDLKHKNGIITLTPNGSESRDGGTKLMYEMMDLFSEFAEEPRES